MKITVFKNKINDFKLNLNTKIASAAFAAEEFEKYIYAITGSGLKKDVSENIISFNYEKSFDDEEFLIEINKGFINFFGGKRGIVYAVYTFLEKLLNVRFFAADEEYLPKKNIAIKKRVYIKENSIIKFRDILGNSADSKDWSLKNKINSNLWGKRGFKEKEGGGYSFAGIPAHSLTGEFLLKKYIDSNPEFFSYKEGKRLTDRMGQACLTNKELVKVLVKEIKEIIIKNPEASFISVSQGDNHNFCKCENCMNAYKNKSITQLFLELVNNVAKEVKKDFPHIMLHTFAYEKTLEFPEGFFLENNVMVQYCSPFCRSHAITDKSCQENVKFKKDFETWSRHCGYVFIWDYINCFKHELMSLPDIDILLDNIRYYADNNVKGIFNEAEHKNTENTDFACFNELKSYLLAKAMWNPYMSKNEYNNHIKDFLNGYYGIGGKFIYKYVKMLCNFSEKCHMDYNCFDFEDKSKVARIIEKKYFEEFIKKGNFYIEKAIKLANSKQCLRLDKLKTQILYYELFFSMENILENGTQTEKHYVLQKNKELIDRIISQNLIITFWGNTMKDQHESLKKCYNISPNNWDYKW